MYNLVKELGGLDFCHNNAGICINAPAEEMTYEQWYKVININLNGGLILFTRTPRFAHSIANDFVSCITAAFEALYAHCGCGTLTICKSLWELLKK